MPSDVIRDAKVWFGGVDISGYLNAVSLGVGRQLKEATPLGSAGIVRKAGLQSVALQVEGFVAEAEELMVPILGVADVPVSVGPTALGVEGEVAYLFRAIEGEYTAGAQIGEMYRFSAGAQSSAGEPLVRGRVLFNGTQTGNGAGLAMNLGAVATGQRLYAALHVISASGTLDADIQTDALEAFGTPTTVHDFAQATAPGAHWASVAGPITDAWVRAAWALSGSFTFVITCGIR